MSAEATSWAARQRGLSSGSKLLLLVLANAAGKDGVTWIGRKTQAADCCYREPSVTENMKRLEAVGLISRVERRRPNGSRTSDYTILAPRQPDRGEMIDAPEDEYPAAVAELAQRTGSVFEPPPGASGSVFGRAQVRFSGGPDPLVEPLGSLSSRAKGGSGGDQTALDVPEERVSAFVAWHGNRLQTDGIPVPAATAAVRGAARDLLRLATGDELRSMFEFATGRTFWASKVATLPKWRQHYAPLRFEWLASRDRGGGPRNDDRPTAPQTRREYDPDHKAVP